MEEAAQVGGNGFPAFSERTRTIGEGSARASRSLYEARSEIVHSGTGEASPFRNGAAFVTGFDLARRSLFKLLREGIPENWDKLGAAVE